MTTAGQPQLGWGFRNLLCLWYSEQHLVLTRYSNSILFSVANGKVVSEALHFQGSTHRSLWCFVVSFHTEQWALPAGTELPCCPHQRCHLRVWSLLTYTSLIKIPFLTSHPQSGAWGVISRETGVPGLTPVWYIGWTVFVMKALAGGSRFVLFFKTHGSRDWLGMFFPGNLWY